MRDDFTAFRTSEATNPASFMIVCSHGSTRHPILLAPYTQNLCIVSARLKYNPQFSKKSISWPKRPFYAVSHSLYHALQRSHSCQYTLYSSSHIVAISLFLTCSNTKKYGEFSTFSLCRLEPRTLVGLLIVAHVTDEIEDALGRAEIDCQVMHSALSATFHVSEPIKYRGSAGFLHANLLISVSKGQYIPLCCTYLEEEFSLCRCEVLQFINDDVFVEVPVFLCNSRIALENRKSEEYLVIECVAMFLTHEP